MPLNLFIDTNILLSFYHFTNDDLEQLEKLTVLIRQYRVKLWVPEQVRDEFWRNREGKINEALKDLKAEKFSKSFPAISKNYEEYAKAREFAENYEKEHAALIKRIEDDVAGLKLKADSVVAKLMKHANFIPRVQELIIKARTRMDVGNPPGKKGSLGDAINWESLLDAVPDGEDLYIIANDGDWRSPVNSENLNYFLINEWTGRKQSRVTYYQRLTGFFSAHYPNIKLASELEKDLLIKDLISSESFYATHKTIARLRNIDEFTQSQVNDLLSAIADNSQVRGILTDSDVQAFYRELYKRNRQHIDPLTWQQLMGAGEEEVDKDVNLEDEY